ncbi:Zinc/iron permease [Phycomyces blakesleeanus]|uniref:Zinc/iron permease n=1 Tax=Phycomyces blakesleeanus TaxID=4837 RepID=A0ABR3B6P4_PHYBL
MNKILDMIKPDLLEGWLMVIFSSVACVAGASVVFVDKLWKPHNGESLLESRSFLAASMALASGVLLFSSLSILLPEASLRLGSPVKTYICFFGGALFTLLLTRLIHWTTPNAIHACGAPPVEHAVCCEDNHSHSHVDTPPLEHAHNNDDYHNQLDQDQDQDHVHNHDHDQEHTHNHAYSSSYTNSHEHEHDNNHDYNSNHDHGHETDLLRPKSHHHHMHKHDIEYGTIRSTEAHFRFHPPENATSHSHSPVQDDLGENIGVDYYSIGIQTAIAITFHKLPEGLIMFISSQASTSLGLSVCIAMSIHNFIEGFMISLPLYYATRSRISAFSYATILGGLSQPLGALIGLFAIRNVSETQENLLFGITFGVVSGMMSLITVQSMLPQAIKADVHQHYVLAFFFLGVFLVALTSILE